VGKGSDNSLNTSASLTGNSNDNEADAQKYFKKFGDDISNKWKPLNEKAKNGEDYNLDDYRRIKELYGAWLKISSLKVSSEDGPIIDGNYS